MLKLIFVLLGFISLKAYAYPEFIAYGYSSCMTCHYNGQGGGPLNDYGRALWSAEIAAKPFYASHKDDEALGAESGFLGSVELPSWLRPHAKLRDMVQILNPSPGNQIYNYYNMQAEIGATIPIDKDEKYLVSMTWGYAPATYGIAGNQFDRWLATEYFFRGQIMEGLFAYVGLIEKVFGIRNVDHESLQRQYQGFQVCCSADGSAYSQGVVIHKVAEKWELSFNGFWGNPEEDPSLQQKGGSAMVEFDVGDKKRMGVSVMHEGNTVKAKDLGAVHYKQALSKGSSLLAEYGIISDQPLVGNNTIGSYNFLELMFKVIRGYNITGTSERYNQMFNPNSPDNWRYTVGLLAFPMPRLEFRFDVGTQRAVSTASAAPDTWFVQGQMHVSL